MLPQNLKKEKEFFSKAKELVFNFLSSFEQNSMAIKYKNMGGAILDPVTSADIEIEKILVKEIKNRFPNDNILAEESSSGLEMDTKKRTWIIDPICGTTNFSRRINNFCTNIALAKDGQLIAACVLDHARNELIWSIGNNKVYVNNSLTKDIEQSIPVIEVDLGSAYYNQDKKLKRKYSNFLYNMLTETNFLPVSHNTSQSFAYTAIGKIDGYFCASPHIWDVAAANLLILQSGGTISDISGKPWTLNSESVIAARDKNIHAKLLYLYLNS